MQGVPYYDVVAFKGNASEDTEADVGDGYLHPGGFRKARLYGLLVAVNI